MLRGVVLGSFGTVVPAGVEGLGLELLPLIVSPEASLEVDSLSETSSSSEGLSESLLSGSSFLLSIKLVSSFSRGLGVKFLVREDFF